MCACTQIHLVYIKRLELMTNFFVKNEGNQIATMHGGSSPLPIAAREMKDMQGLNHLLLNTVPSLHVAGMCTSVILKLISWSTADKQYNPRA